MNSKLLTLLSVCTAVLAFLKPALYAASIVHCQLVMDGASSPPGDRIDCVVRLAPTDVDVQLEIRAYLRSDESGIAAVQAASGRNRDEQGHLRVVESVSDSAPLQKVSVVVPYSDLDIPIGKFDIVYVLSLKVEGTSVWTQPLPTTQVRISDRSRSQLEPVAVDQTPLLETRIAKCLIGKSTDNFDDRPIRIEAATTESSLKSSTKEPIARSFARSRVPLSPAHDKQSLGLADQPWQPLSEVANPQERIVYFATNRRLLVDSSQEDSAQGVNNFGTDLSDDLHFGQCVVNFPIRHHKRGNLEVATWFERTNPAKHFLVMAIQELSRTELMQPLGDDDLLIYVHGFDNTFEDAVLRSGQLKYDTDFSGNVLAFSWPSLGSMTPEDYKNDTGRAEKSVRALADLLEFASTAARNSQPARKVHVIAHSLGNRLLLSAIHNLAAREVWKPDEKYLGQIVMAAPDVGAIQFNNVINYAIRSSERASYYYCRTDLALQMSQNINSFEPVGLYPFFQQNLDTISADGVDTSFIGHGYYGSSTQVLADFNLLFCNHYAPAQRMPPITAHSRVYDHDHWSFLPVDIREQ
jgi:esterase/lipase superfamily enzyme